MKPARFTTQDNVEFEDPKTGHRLVSKFDDEKPNISLYSEKKLVWSIPEYIGRKSYELSPDGKKILIYGDFHFGHLIHLDPKTEFAVLYLNGKKNKIIKIKDVYKNFKKDMEVFGLNPKIGDWVSYHEIIKAVSVDWDKSELIFHLPNGKIIKKF